MAGPWSDYTDNLISDIDESLGSKYGKMNLRKFLNDPLKFASQADIGTTFQNLKNDTESYISSMLEGLGKEKQEFEDNLIKADTMTVQLGNNISMEAKQLKIPFITPALMERDESSDEKIYVDSVNTDVFSLIEKLVTNATYVADNSYTYMDKKVGDWLFGGRKNYVLRVYLPQNTAMLLSESKEEIDGLLDTAEGFIKKQ